MPLTPSLWGDVGQANINGGANAPDVVGLTAGGPFDGYMAIWVEGSGFFTVQGQRYSALGIPVSAFSFGPFPDTGGGALPHSEIEPAIASLPNKPPQPGSGSVAPTSKFAVAFVNSVFDPDTLTSTRDLFVYVYEAAFASPDGDPSTIPPIVRVRTDTIENTALNSSNPSIASFSNGGYVVAYEYEIFAGDIDIVAQIVSSDGTPSPLSFINIESGAQFDPQVSVLSNGSFVVVYEQFTDDDVGYAIYTQAGGFVAEDEILGAADTTIKRQADVAALKNGGFVVAWSADGSGFSTEEIRLSVLSNSGSSINANVLVNTAEFGQRSPNIVALPDGGFIVSWIDGEHETYRGQRFDASGNKVGVQFDIAPWNDNWSDDIEGSVMHDGRVVFSYEALAGVLTTIFDPRTGPIIGTDGLDNLTGHRHENSTIFGRGGNDIIYGLEGNDQLFGEGGHDIITGYLGNDRISGGPGNDQLVGDAGNDTIFGDTGNDRLFGQNNNDVLNGGSGSDELSGGPGRDRFDFDSIKETKKGGQRDQILDFKRGQDDIDLRTIDATKGASGHKFKWIGKKGFHDEKGELRYKDLGSKVIVQGDVNGDGKADFEIYVGVGSLGKGDFLL